jgi:hypothetical protein
MVMTYFLSILARILALTDAVLDSFVGVPAFVDLNGLGFSNCTDVYLINVSVTPCGQALADQIEQLIFSGVGFLNSILTALGATNDAYLAINTLT